MKRRKPNYRPNYRKLKRVPHQRLYGQAFKERVRRAAKQVEKMFSRTGKEISREEITKIANQLNVPKHSVFNLLHEEFHHVLVQRLG